MVRNRPLTFRGIPMTAVTLPILAYDQVISGYYQAPAGLAQPATGHPHARAETDARGLPVAASAAATSVAAPGAPAASNAPAHARLRRVRLPAATLAQLRAWFDDTAVTLDHTCTCGFADPSSRDPAPAAGAAALAAVHVHGLRRNEAFHDWVITGALAGLVPADVLQQITPLDDLRHPAPRNVPPDAYRLPAAAPLRRAS